MLLSAEAVLVGLVFLTLGAGALLTLGGIVCHAACRERRGRATSRT